MMTAKQHSESQSDDNRDHHGGHDDHQGESHHAHMIRDFQRRFWISLALTLPIVALVHDSAG